MKPFRFQTECVNEIEWFNGRALLGLPPGLGKTYISLLWIAKREAWPAVVICPASVKFVWEREARRALGVEALVAEGWEPTAPIPSTTRLLVVNYDILAPRKRKNANPTTGWGRHLKRLEPTTVVLDECLPSDSVVITEVGPRTIGQLVNDRKPLKVLSWNFRGNVLEFRRITQYIRKRRDQDMVCIRHEGGELWCTANHRVWERTNGYVKAEDLKVGNQLRTLRGDDGSLSLPNPTTQSHPVLFPRLCSRESDAGGTDKPVSAGNLPNHGGSATSKILIRTDADEQSNVTSRNCREDEADEVVQWNAATMEGATGRQRAVDEPAGTSLDGVRGRLDDRVGYSHGICAGRIGVSQQLQSRHRTCQAADSRGSGRPLPPLETSEGRGPEETKPVSFSRVESVEVYQRRDRQRHGGGRGSDSVVYCLEVEGNHNFFADNVLVSNCHYTANGRSKRTQAVRRLCSGAPYVLGLSGTPLVNRPMEMFPVLNILRPGVKQWKSRWEFGRRFCNPRLTPWGWDYSGASNTKALHRLLGKHLMIRRRKADVLKDLPRKLRTVTPIPLTDRTEYDRADGDFLEWLGAQSPKKAAKAARAEELTKLGYLLRLVARLKAPLLAEWIKEWAEGNDEKMVVFGVHKDTLATLRQAVGLRSLLIDGSVKGRARKHVVDEFQEGRTRLLFANIVAGGTGITLTAARTVVFAELAWRPGDHLQAEDRCHRIGATQTVWAYYLVGANTIEETLCRVLQEKQQVLERVLDGGDGDDTLNVFDELMDEIRGRRFTDGT